MTHNRQDQSPPSLTQVSMKRRHFLLQSASASVLAACTAPAIPTGLDMDNVKTVFVSTTRAMNPDTGWPGNAISETHHWFEIDISRTPFQTHIDRARRVPPLRRGQPRPLSTRTTLLERLAQEQRRTGGQEAFLFVHGFNSTMDSSLNRAMQMMETIGSDAVPVHFAWASNGSPFSYIADTENMLASRDALESTLETLHAAGLKTIVLAHSMGGHLLMETLRQMAIANSPALRTITGVFLVAPDIDVGLFRTQLRRIPRLPNPFLIVTNREDRVLALSRNLSGQRDRLGNLAHPERIADFEITLVDVTALSGRWDHFPVANSPGLATLLARFSSVPGAFEDPRRVGDLITGTIIGVRSLTQIVLEPNFE